MLRSANNYGVRGGGCALAASPIRVTADVQFLRIRLFKVLRPFVKKQVHLGTSTIINCMYADARFSCVDVLLIFNFHTETIVWRNVLGGRVALAEYVPFECGDSWSRYPQ